MDRQVVKKTPLFASLDEETAMRLVDSMTPTRLARGESVFEEGDPGDSLYVIVTGKMKLARTSGDGRESLLSVLGPGEMFGELSLFDPGPRLTSARAVSEAELISLGNADLRNFLQQHPEVAMTISLHGIAP